MDSFLADDWKRPVVKGDSCVFLLPNGQGVETGKVLGAVENPDGEILVNIQADDSHYNIFCTVSLNGVVPLKPPPGGFVDVRRL